MQYGRMHIIIILCDASMTTKLKKRVVVLGVGVWVCHGKCITVIHFWHKSPAQHVTVDFTG